VTGPLTANVTVPVWQLECQCPGQAAVTQSESESSMKLEGSHGDSESAGPPARGRVTESSRSLCHWQSGARDRRHRHGTGAGPGDRDDIHCQGPRVLDRLDRSRAQAFRAQLIAGTAGARQ
jgi:hypothetical protein